MTVWSEIDDKTLLTKIEMLHLRNGSRSRTPEQQKVPETHSATSVYPSAFGAIAQPPSS